MSNAPAPAIVLGSWDALGAEAGAIRLLVFVNEQKVPEELELDENDAACVHALARDAQGRAVGTARLLPDGHIGRMAVLPAWRGAGLGGRMLEMLVAKGWEQGHRELALSAQTHARGFYEAHGFVAQGGVYPDAGIPHILMTRAREG
jgi:predicted GNAT family N-acyltransferase